MTTATGIRIKLSHTDSYKEALDKCYQAFKQDQSYANRISFGIITMAYIEYACNTLLVDFCERTFVEDVADTYARYFTKLEIKAKIEIVVSLVTNFRFVADKGHNTIQSLIKLIGIRNKIVHKKDTYEDVKGTPDEATSSTTFTVSTSDENLEKLTSSEVDRFYNAALNFVAKTLEEYGKSYSLTLGDFIVENPKNNA
jgi:hypothetical protein